MREDLSLPEFIGEIALYAAVCLAGGGLILAWRASPILGVLTVATIACAAVWLGYRMRTLLEPESGRPRRVRAAVTAAAFVGGGAFVLWASLCSCL